MAWKIDKQKCLRCGACVSVCPELALDLREDGLKNDMKKCTLCGICERVCPSRAIEVKK
ncbi:MAG: 4Fe-4S binding protein [Candidatus Aenigmarchaeota archaeon]|nr:4Fe-4S binding protein [Candidatus Aenigmarchaeota archaeon]